MNTAATTQSPAEEFRPRTPDAGRPRKLRTILRRTGQAALFPVIYLCNRPALAFVGRAAYDVALRLNGIVINYKGPLGLTLGEERFLAAHARQLQLVLDVGANHGLYAKVVRTLAPQATIHAFEPHPRTYRHLRRLGDAHRIETHELALSDQDGEFELFDFADEEGSTQASLSRDAVALFNRGVVSHRVTVTTVDSFVAQHGIDRISLLKIDTEGRDLTVLRGARRTIARGAVDMIQFEFSRASVGTRTFLRDFFDELAGYEIFRICLNGQLLKLMPYEMRRCEIFQNQNLVAIRK
jgi:FkbM family methyltransferase